MVTISQRWGRDGSVVFKLKVYDEDKMFHSMDDLINYLKEL